MHIEDQKTAIFRETKKELQDKGFSIRQQDMTRPWGGFFVIEETQAQAFADAYFDGIKTEDLQISGKLSPKILLVEPQKRLSWQYHHRRAEIWKVLNGTVGVVTSDTDEEGELKTLHPGDMITLKQGERHRLVGLDGWGVLAEIWQHTDALHASDEQDIIRLQDDFNR